MTLGWGVLWASVVFSSQPAPETPRLVVQSGHLHQVTSAAFSRDGRLLASGDRRGMILLWDAASGLQLRPLAGHNDAIRAIAFSPDGRWLASSSGYGGREAPAAIVHDVSTGRLKHEWTHFTERLDNLAFGPDGALLATAGEKLSIWNIETGAQVREIQVEDSRMLSFAFSPDGAHLAVREPARLRLLPLRADASPGPEFALNNYYGREAVAFSPGGERVATRDGGLLKVWDLQTRKIAAELKIDTGFAVAGFADQAGEVAIAVGDRFEIWDLASGRRVRTLASGVRTESVLSRDWRQLAEPLQPDPASLTLHDLASGGRAKVLAGRLAPAGAVAFSPNGSLLLAKSGPLFSLWDLRGAEPRSFHAHEQRRGGRIEIDVLAFHPDGRRFYSADWTHRIAEWDLASAKPRATIALTAGGSTIRHALSSRGQWMVSAQTGQVLVYDAATWQVAGTLDCDDVRAVAISPDGRWIAVAPRISSWTCGIGRPAAGVASQDILTS
jgi:WD40 repeat protein